MYVESNPRMGGGNSSCMSWVACMGGEQSMIEVRPIQ